VVPIQWFKGLIIPIIVFLATAIWATDVMATGNLEDGNQLYQQRCSMCHGTDGKGNTPTAKALNPKPRDHTDGTYMNAISNEHLSKVIKQGGTAVGKSPLMPPQTDLNDQQIQDLATFVRSLAVPPYTGN
jgi:mono/diheme cytochrome c family protein